MQVEDTATALPQEFWFRAADYEAELNAYAQEMQGPPCYHCIDLFGASEAMKKAWNRNGFEAASFDYLLGGAEHLRQHKCINVFVLDFWWTVNGPPVSTRGGAEV